MGAAPATGLEKAAGRPTGPGRFGYLVSIAVSGLMLYIAHQLLPWGWPNFLTSEFNDVLPIITVSLVASIVANALFFWYDAEWFKSIADLVGAVIGFVASVQLFRVFPFDFSTYSVDWSWLVRSILIVAIVGTAIGAIVNLVKFATTAGRR